MGWLQVVLGSVVSGIVVAAITSLLLDRRLERFKHDLQVEATTHELTVQSQIEFKERQLSELYGPVYAMLKRGRKIVALWKEGKLKSIEPRFWELARGTNDRIEDLLLTKSHLIEGDAIPDSYIGFLIHVPIWQAFAESERGIGSLSFEAFPEAYYNEDFEKEVFQTTRRLKKELHELYRRYGLVTRLIRKFTALVESPCNLMQIRLTDLNW